MIKNKPAVKMAKAARSGGLEGWLTIAEAMLHRKLRQHDGTPYRPGSVTNLCNRSKKQQEEGQRPVLHRNSGDIGCMFYGGMWFIHAEALENFVPPQPGNPMWKIKD